MAKWQSYDLNELLDLLTLYGNLMCVPVYIALYPNGCGVIKEQVTNKEWLTFYSLESLHNELYVAITALSNT